MNFDDMYMDARTQSMKLPPEPPIDVQDSEVITLPKIDVTAPRLDDQGNAINPQRNTLEGPTQILPRGSMMLGAEPVLSRGALPQPNIIDQLVGEGVTQFVEDVEQRPAESMYGIAKGAAQGFLGLPGDVESLIKGAYYATKTPEGQSRLEEFVKGMESGTVLPTTENVASFFNQFLPESGTPGAEGLGEILAPGGYIKYGGEMIDQAKQAGQVIGKEVARQYETGEGVIGKMSIDPRQYAVDAGADFQIQNVVSTRLPTAKKATEDPIRNQLVIDYNTIKSDKKSFDHNVSLMNEYPNFNPIGQSTEENAENYIDEIKNNLLYLHDKVPETIRQRSKLWYDGARKITNDWSSSYGIPDQSVSGVIAVLSPQKDWFMNVSLANRTIDIFLNKSDFSWSNEMTSKASSIFGKPQYKPIIDAIKNKKLSEISDPAEKALWIRTYDETYNPRQHNIVTPEGELGDIRYTKSGNPYSVAWGSLNEIGKAVSILDNPSKENISQMLGTQHKVRNFYNNIYAPNDPSGYVTIDTHAVAAGLMRPLSGNSREVLHNFGSNIKGERGPANSSVTGANGTYGLYAEAYNRAAQERGILPREMQSITWEAVRGLFPDTYKTAKNAKIVDDIWARYRNGQITIDQAREEVINAAGGINAPEWN